MAKLEEVFQCQLQFALVGMVLVTTPKVLVPCVVSVCALGGLHKSTAVAMARYGF